ncbi:wee1-like protein kinase 1-A [Tubulanus polymorphus]|uniref:wee1-like protein kinase 1-A n=1 Tax=Tubulanus polymorphus TaxID=672921 RepID=UPI003DA6A793
MSSMKRLTTVPCPSRRLRNKTGRTLAQQLSFSASDSDCEENESTGIRASCGMRGGVESELPTGILNRMVRPWGDSAESDSDSTSPVKTPFKSLKYAALFRTASSTNNNNDSSSVTVASSRMTTRSRSKMLAANFTTDAMMITEEDSDVGDEAEDDDIAGEKPRPSWTPPHKRLRALKLFDTPHTPKSLLERSRSLRLSESKPSSSPTALFPVTGGGEKDRTVTTGDKKPEDRLQANINPFTPDNNSNTGLKRPRHTSGWGSFLEDSTDEDIDVDMPSNKKIALREINTSRYNEEFYEVCKLGDGEFGSVYKCVNRLDGCIYAIKKSKAPVAGSVYERNAVNEVYAHAVLGKHPHVVRYYSAWAENDYMFIQNEYCNGGSLADIIAENYRENHHFTEAELYQLLLQLSHGLKYIHSQNLVHLDLKPGNIFIHRTEKITNSPENIADQTEQTVDEEDEPPIFYKIGDLGHVTSASNPCVEEGDCRYLPNEILQDDFTHLQKADIFSLGLTIFVAAGGGELPKNGQEWHAIRRGELPNLNNCSKQFNDLLKSMIDSDATKRLSASQLTQHSLLRPGGAKSRAQLRKELNEERFKNEVLSRQLREATLYQMDQQQKFRQPNQLASSNNKNSRLVGRKTMRSMSLTAF